jgi:hypothetical protein
MRKRLLAFVVVAIVLVCTGSSAAPEPARPAAPTPPSPEDGGVCGVEEPHCITHEFSPGNNSFLYDFSGFPRSTLRVNFVGGVLTTFKLTVRDVTLTDAQLTARLDPRVFPAGTSCFHYFDGKCHQYSFSGNAGGPHGVPVIRVDYNPPGVELTLSYSTSDLAFDPAFGHAPGDNIIFSEDILRNYFREPPPEDDTMDSDPVPGLSDVIALNKPLEENDTYCRVSPQDGQIFGGEHEEIEVAFRLFASGPCIGNPGRPLRDRDARLSLVKRLDSGEVVFQHVRVEHFHFDQREGINEAEIETEDLTPGTYFITVRSDEFSPDTVRVIIAPGHH